MTQSRTDKSTWTWSMNAALIILDYLWHSDGGRIPYVLLEPAIDDWKAQADICDEAVDLAAGGSVPRYQLAGGYYFDAAPRDVLPQMLDPIFGKLKQRADGALILRVGQAETPGVTIADEDILSFQMQRGLDVTDMRNEIRATYTSPDDDYQTQDTDPWDDQDSIDTQGLQSAALDLGWSPNVSQTRRRQKIEAYRLNPPWNGTITTNMRGLRALDETVLTVQIAELSVDETFEKTSFKADIGTGTCVIGIRSLSAAAFDWDAATEEGSGSSTTSGGDDDAPEEPSNLAGEATIIQVNDTVSGRGIFLSVDTPSDPDLKLVADYAAAGGGAKIAFSIEANTFHGISGLVSVGNYDLRAWFVDSRGRQSSIATASASVGLSATDNFFSGSGNFIIPAGATGLIVELTGNGGGGGDGLVDPDTGEHSPGGGGGSGAYITMTMVLDPADESVEIAYAFDDSGATTISGTIVAGVIALQAGNGGGGGGGDGGSAGSATATGNTAGTPTLTDGAGGVGGGSGTAGSSVDPLGSYGNGGGGGAYVSFPGNAGRVRFKTTFDS